MASYPNLSIVAAMADNRVIGKGNRLPWHLPADLAHFKRLTLGRPIIMGRRTWESLPGLLPHRTHIVITRQADFHAEGATVVHSIDEAMTFVGDADEVMVVGGADLYAQTIPLASRMHLTHVHALPDGDRFFPEFDRSQWRQVGHEARDADERNPFAMTFVTLQRIGSTS